MTRAERAALKQFPIPYEISEDDRNILVNTGRRRIYANGYRQAEKDTIERAVAYIESLNIGLDSVYGCKIDVGSFKEAMEKEEA